MLPIAELGWTRAVRDSVTLQTHPAASLPATLDGPAGGEAVFVQVPSVNRQAARAASAPQRAGVGYLPEGPAQALWAGHAEAAVRRVQVRA
jgi:hypothetical protein